MRGLERLRDLGGGSSVEAVVTACYPDVSEVYFHLLALGFSNIALKPVRAHPQQPFAIGQNLAAICAGYDRFVDRLLALPGEELLRHLLTIGADHGTGDYFARFLMRVMRKVMLNRRCPAWVNRLGVDTDGLFYGCNSLLGVPEARIGSVWDGINEARVQELAERTHISQREPCRNCWARYLCGGGCFHQSYLTFGEFGPPDPAECALNRHLIELAIWMLSEMQRTHPNVLAALPSPVKRPWRATPPVLCHNVPPPVRESSQLRASMQALAPCGALHLETGLKRRLLSPADHGELEARLAWDPRNLQVLLTPRDVDLDGYWERIKSISIDFALPRELADSALTRIPPRLQEFNWSLKADPGAAQVSYLSTPDTSQDRQAIPSSLVASDAKSLLLSVPWSALKMRSPEAGMEFGLGVTLSDKEGGELRWRPEWDAVKVRLMR
jgi:radical SAM protein with 4Fe4S-binding SPASM domain